jgi:hypothetical protein
VIDFPMNYMIRIVDLWQKLVPQNPSTTDYSKEDIVAINSAKNSIKEFRLNLIDYIEHLQDYIKHVKKLQPMKTNF